MLGFNLVTIIVAIIITSAHSSKELFKFNKLPEHNNMPQRIVGGVDVPKGRYIPYQVSMQYLTKDGQQHFCGGSILTPNRILTAAHCCDGLNATRMSVVAGIRDLNDSSGQRSFVKSYEIHENYQKLVTSDIAILNIDPPLQFDGQRVDAIDVRGKELVGGGQAVTLTGWGLRLPVPFPFLWDSINYPTILQTMTYTTVTNKECKESGMDELTDTEICAKGRFFKAACSGDSGGPLVMSTSNGLKQVGIVSYGLAICGIFDVPDVYTRVSVFDEWIQERLNTTKNVLSS